MLSSVNTVTFSGIETVAVDMQIHLLTGLPAFNIVGLPDKTIGEAKERVRSALSSIGLGLPAKRITVNLSPADIFKEGSHFDLPIAVGLLIAMDILPREELCDYILLGELGLDGKLVSVSGVLPASIDAVAKNKGLICPKANGKEAVWSGNQMILAAESLLQIIGHFKGSELILPPEKGNIVEDQEYLNFSDVKGQETAKRAMEIAAAGQHNILMSGSPGAGKSMIAARLPGILPPMNSKQILETSMINSIAGKMISGDISDKRPFRAPHHSCSMAAMTGGGMKKIFPGEISLAHNGVLFLDELPEFPRTVIESLRQPLENRKISIARANSHVTYPANFQLVAAMNPCKCGFLFDQEKSCKKAPLCGAEYQNKISGPFIDRIDLYLDIETPKIEEIMAKNVAEKSETIKERVMRAREIQEDRYNGFGISNNSEINGDLLYELIAPDHEGLEMLNKAAEKFKFSMRSYNKLIKISRTIADLENTKITRKKHVAEALTYRQVQVSRNSNIPKLS